MCLCTCNQFMLIYSLVGYLTTNPLQLPFGIAIQTLARFKRFKLKYGHYFYNLGLT